MAIQIPRGTADILPGEIEQWQYIEEKAKDLCRRYHYEEIRTPIFEHTELFQRGVGETTDIVQKEMYTFQDRSGRSLTLRPEGTASVVRSFIENKLYGQPEQPTKLYYIGPVFRYERPQKGRTRQFSQFGVEVFGSKDPAIDVEVIAMGVDFCRELGLQQVKPVINSLGDTESRNNYRKGLVQHFQPRIGEFCADCQERLHKNPLRILDCKKDQDHELMTSAPSILDFLNDESRQYFEDVKTHLTNMGIAYKVDPTLVRGLDYYNHTAFEFVSEAEDADTSISGGGRYNGLVEEIGGPDVAGIGFAFSIERLFVALAAEGISLPVAKSLDCYIVTIGERSKEAAPALLHKLRRAGLAADKDYLDRKVKAQFKGADRFNTKYVATLGDDELEAGVTSIKDLTNGEEEQIPLDQLVPYIKQNV